MDPWLGKLLPNPNYLIQTRILRFPRTEQSRVSMRKISEISGFYAPVRPHIMHFIYLFLSTEAKEQKQSAQASDLHVLDILHAFEQGQDQTQAFIMFLKNLLIYKKAKKKRSEAQLFKKKKHYMHFLFSTNCRKKAMILCSSFSLLRFASLLFLLRFASDTQRIWVCTLPEPEDKGSETTTEQNRTALRYSLNDIFCTYPASVSSG